LGMAPDRGEVVDLYRRELGAVLGAELVPGEWTMAEEARARELDRTLGAEEWFGEKGASRRAGIKIHEDVHIGESAHKAPGGLIRVTARLRQGRVDDLSISGDFTVYPREAVAEIERALRGSSADRQAILAAVEERYGALAIQSPGVGPEDWAEAVWLAAGQAITGPEGP
jgi:lipoate---protein ligase